MEGCLLFGGEIDAGGDMYCVLRPINRWRQLRFVSSHDDMKSRDTRSMTPHPTTTAAVQSTQWRRVASKTLQTPWHISLSMRCGVVPLHSRRSCWGRQVLYISVEMVLRPARSADKQHFLYCCLIYTIQCVAATVQNCKCINYMPQIYNMYDVVIVVHRPFSDRQQSSLLTKTICGLLCHSRHS